MRISQMNPTSDVKLWDKSSKVRTAFLDRMSDKQKAVWEKLVDPRLAHSRKPIRRAKTARGGFISFF